MPSPGDAEYEIWLDNFYCGVRSMAPFGVWLPWQEGVTLAAAFGFTENVCFECADTWLQLDALEFDPPRRSGDGSGRADVQRIRLLYKRDLHGDDGLVIVSCDEEDVISPQHAPPNVCRRWRSGALGPIAGVEVDLALPRALDEQNVRLLLVYTGTCTVKLIKNVRLKICRQTFRYGLGSCFQNQDFIGLRLGFKRCKNLVCRRCRPQTTNYPYLISAALASSTATCGSQWHGRYCALNRKKLPESSPFVH